MGRRPPQPLSYVAALAAIGVASLFTLEAAAHEGEHGHVHPEAEEAAGETAGPPGAVDAELAITAGDDGQPPPPPPESSGAEPGAAPPPAPPLDGPPDDGHGSWEPRSISDNDWRRSSKRPKAGESDGDWLDPSHFLFELRFGPYSPEVDEEFDGATPYADTFGDDARFYFGLELDWLPLHIPYVGSLGVGFGWGYTSSSGATTVASTGAEAGSETSLSIHPMHLSGILRLDGLLRRLRIPIVPYVKLGLGFGVWDASGPNGTSEVNGVTGEGTSLGLHTAIGGALALNAFDASAAVAMREETGIRYAYLYGEWMGANLDGIGDTPQMHVGTSTVVLGLALDF
ncbi:MAG: hypothetical protein JRI68_03790 [Deltaproteobacteria bacterium]|nr:hypothetical protein [Deltaproteobacteria bacterium]